MPDLLTPLSDICQTQLEASRRVADAIFSGTGKMDRILLDATHRALDEQLRYAQAVGNARDPQVVANLQATFWSAKPEQVQSFQQECMRILAEMQNEVGRAAQSFIEQFGLNGMRALPSAISLAAPSHTAKPATANPFGPIISTWQSALQNAAQLSKQGLASAQTLSAAMTPVTGRGAAENNQRSQARRQETSGADDVTDAGDVAGMDAPSVNDEVASSPTSSHHAGPSKKANGNGHDHQAAAAAATGGTVEERADVAGDDAPQSRRAQDEADEPSDAGNGAGGSGKKSAQNRRK